MQERRCGLEDVLGRDNGRGNYRRIGSERAFSAFPPLSEEVPQPVQKDSIDTSRPKNET